AASHRIAILSDEAVTTSLPSAEIATLVQPAGPPLNIWRFLPLTASQRIAVPSADPVSTCLLSAANAELVMPSECTRRDWRLMPVAASHRIAVRSADPVATTLPSADRDTAETRLLCPVGRIGSSLTWAAILVLWLGAGLPSDWAP